MPDGELEKPFDIKIFLATQGPGRRTVSLRAKGIVFSQGAAADSVFYLQTGKAELTVVSKGGKEATVTLLAAGDFFGEEAMTGTDMIRTAGVRTTTVCKILQIERKEMLRVMHGEPTFSAFFLNFILLKSARTQADLVDQLFNSSEKRLARTLLLMAEFGQPGEPETLLPPISQGALAGMIGTSRSRVSFFMNRFRKFGYINYNGRIRVYKSRLNVVLHDQLPEQNASRPKMQDPLTSPARTARRAKLL